MVRNLLLIRVPGISFALFEEQRENLPALSRLAESYQGTIVPVQGLDLNMAERVLDTGVLPEDCDGTSNFVDSAVKKSPTLEVTSVRGMSLEAKNIDWLQQSQPRLLDWMPVDAWITVKQLQRVDAQLQSLVPSLVFGTLVVAPHSACTSGAPNEQECPPEKRPLIIADKVDIGKPHVGVCEVAGIIERHLTGELVPDQL